MPSVAERTLVEPDVERENLADGRALHVARDGHGRARFAFPDESALVCERGAWRLDSAPSSPLWVPCPVAACGSREGELCVDGRRWRALSSYHFLRRVAFEAAVAAARGRPLLRPDHRAGCNKQCSGAACNCGVDWTLGLEEPPPGVPWSRRAPEDDEAAQVA